MQRGGRCSVRRMKLGTAIAISLLACACSKKKGDGDYYAGWKAADTKAALQGAWIGPSTANLLEKAAYEITGDTVKVFDGKDEKTYKLELENPCQIGLKQPDGTTYHMGVVSKDGKVTWGGGDAGVRTGDRAVMCAGLQTWVVVKGKCNERSLSGRWEQNDKCGFRAASGSGTAGGGEEFFWTWMDKQDSAKMDGDLLWEFKDSPAKKLPDYAAAKAELAAAKPE